MINIINNNYLLPKSDIVPAYIIPTLLNTVTNSYKFYWFLSILEKIKNDDLEISIDDLALEMLSLIWYPLDYYKISFGKQDSFKYLVDIINKDITIDNSINSPSIITQIENACSENDADKYKKVIIKILTKFVQFRFLRPFFKNELQGKKDAIINNAIFELTFITDKKIIYKFSKDKKKIILDSDWLSFFKTNLDVIRGYTYWRLLQFLQKNNPNVIGLSEKIFKPRKRDLKNAASFWNLYFNLNHGNIKCIYSNTHIEKNNYSLDHFIPWSYVVHDKLWNLVPTLRDVNSSKSNCLPNLDKYLSAFTDIQYSAFTKIYDKYSKKKLLEDYALLFNASLETIRTLEQPKFCDVLRSNIEPMYQIAKNSGFPENWIYKKNELVELFHSVN